MANASLPSARRRISRIVRSAQSFVSLEGISYQQANKIAASAITLNGANWSPHTGFGLDVGAAAAYRTGGIVRLEDITYAAGNTLPSVAGIFTNTSNWSQFGAFGSAAPGWFEDTGGFIHLEGGLQRTSASGPNALLLGTLPIVARPTRTVYTIVHTYSGTYADLAITPAGQILVIPPRPPAVADVSFVSLEGITFDASSPKQFELAVSGSESSQRRSQPRCASHGHWPCSSRQCTDSGSRRSESCVWASTRPASRTSPGTSRSTGGCWTPADTR